MSKLKKILSMNTAKVEYVYEDEDGQEYTAEEHQLQEEDLLEQEGQTVTVPCQQEIMIVEQTTEIPNNGGGTSLNHDLNAERDPDCKRRDSHHCWGIQQSLRLIETMKQYKDELANASNRREVWQKIHQDVCSKGLSVSVQECQNKWKNLIRSYKECTKMKNKDNMRFRYFKEMSDYFGGEKFFPSDHDYNKTKLTLMPLLSSGSSTGSQPTPTVTFPPICFTDRQFIEYTNMKREEYAARQKRHEEEMNLRKQELEVHKKKLEVMKKAAMASLQGNKTVNFDFPCRWPDEATSLLISIIRRRKYEMADRDQQKKPALWNEIMQEMVDNGYQVTVKEIKSKWRNLIRTYNLRCKNPRQKGFKFKFFNDILEFFKETTSLGIDPVVFEVYAVE